MSFMTIISYIMIYMLIGVFMCGIFESQGDEPSLIVVFGWPVIAAFVVAVAAARVVWFMGRKAGSVMSNFIKDVKETLEEV